MLTLYFTPGACSLAAHIVLEESGEAYEKQLVDLAKGEQRSEPYLKINPQGRVPVLRLDNGEPLSENTAILPFLGKRFGLWPSEPIAEARALSLIGFFAASVHPAHAHIGRPERYAADPAAYPTIKETGLKTFHGHLKQIDDMLAGREWFADQYSVLDAYGLVFYAWGFRRELPVQELKSYSALKDRMLQRPAVRRVVVEEKLALARDLPQSTAAQ
jgi:glutathione S-transferase